MNLNAKRITDSLKVLIGEITNVDNMNASLRQYRQLLENSRKLREAETAEVERAQNLRAQFAGLDAQRIEALTECRLSGNHEAAQRAAELAEQIAPLQRAATDAEAIAAGIDSRLAALASVIEQAARHARQDLGLALEQKFCAVAQCYQEQAQEVAELALQIAALQALMMRLRCGNTNGFDGSIRLPAATPGDARTSEPLVDGHSTEFRRAAESIAEVLAGDLLAAGYSSR